ncbi:DUF6931 family protein [Shinella fusca]|uniref:Uncharacterized protein n=1 Tax=Shinella fusca TaxID=544480 RepID=A0A7W7YSC9_9HYPH|nr:hypothetical protein [Shinella fusca]MBB5041354.1 hypothetical protein [Shinella fusca]
MVKIQTEAFRKVTAETAQEICGRADLSAEARPFLLPDLSPQGFLSLLVDAENIGDSIRFLAFALPIREAVWWAYVVAKTSLHAPTELELLCLERAAAWVYAPDEARRRSCMECAESANFTGAAAYAALAVFWSGGSLAPEGMPDAEADPRLGPIGVGASVLLSITAGDATTLADRFETAVVRAVNVANGGNGWLPGERPTGANGS